MNIYIGNLANKLNDDKIRKKELDREIQLINREITLNRELIIDLLNIYDNVPEEILNTYNIQNTDNSLYVITDNTIKLGNKLYNGILDVFNKLNESYLYFKLLPDNYEITYWDIFYRPKEYNTDINKYYSIPEEYRKGLMYYRLLPNNNDINTYYNDPLSIIYPYYNDNNLVHEFIRNISGKTSKYSTSPIINEEILNNIREELKQVIFTGLENNKEFHQLPESTKNDLKILVNIINDIYDFRLNNYNEFNEYISNLNNKIIQLNNTLNIKTNELSEINNYAADLGNVTPAPVQRDESAAKLLISKTNIFISGIENKLNRISNRNNI